MVGNDLEISGLGYCGKGHKEWVKVSSGGPHIKFKNKIGIGEFIMIKKIKEALNKNNEIYAWEIKSVESKSSQLFLIKIT